MMRYEKNKRVVLLTNTASMIDAIEQNEVEQMKCPMCQLGEENQILVESDGMTKPKCKGCGTIFFDSSAR